MPSVIVEESSFLRTLEEIQQHKIERDRISGVDPLRASHIQCEIFRKFAILDSWMSAVEVWSPKTWRLHSLISKQRKLANAESSDLQHMAIPSSISSRWKECRMGNVACDKMNESNHWKSYLDLPPEVRVQILKNISSATDKLHILREVPAEGPLMNWNITYLQFEFVLPILLKQRALTWRDGVSLRRVNSNFRTIINREFEISLRSNRWSRHNWSLENRALSFDLNIGRLNNTDLNGENPLLAKLQLKIHQRDNRETRSDLFQLLIKIGHSVWDCEINEEDKKRDSHLSLWHVFERIRRCLCLMPNLRRLCINGQDYEPITEEAAAEFEAMVFPELRKLQCLVIRCGSEHSQRIVSDKLLGRSGKSLKILHVSPRCLIGGIEENCSELVELHISNAVTGGTVGGVGRDLLHSLFQPFSSSPLKKLSISIWSGGNEDRVKFSSLFHSGLHSFQGTLEELDFLITDIMSLNSQIDTSSKWTPGDICFPKLRKFTTANFPGNWNLLLHFPALEELRLRNYSIGSNEVKRKLFLRTSSVLQLTGDVKKMYTSNIWKLLPSLQIIAYQNWNCKTWRYESGTEFVTRAKCVVGFQESYNNNKTPLNCVIC